jgi:hypothetical protein
LTGIKDSPQIRPKNRVVRIGCCDVIISQFLLHSDLVFYYENGSFSWAFSGVMNPSAKPEIKTSRKDFSTGVRRPEIEILIWD